MEGGAEVGGRKFARELDIFCFVLFSFFCYFLKG